MKTKWRMLATFAGVVVAILALGSVAWAAVISNSGSISIPDTGKATPYPATIDVSGLSGTTTDVNVTLHGVRHTYPDDVSALLVGPGGQNVMLMSDVGATNDLNGVGLTFDDEATGKLPDSAQITAGTYNPTQGTNSSGGTARPASLPSPAPAGPYGTSLSPFDGSDPNGTYSLYVFDDTSQDAGGVTSGFSLDIKTTADGGTTTPNDKPPDLGMARLGNFSVQQSGSSSRLRFDATIVNVGTGAFEVLGSRDSTSDTTMDTVSQVIYDDAGASRSRPAENTTDNKAQMVFGGDGHSHWHVKDLEKYELAPLDSGNTSRPRTGAKSGFCFYDNARYQLTLPGAPQSVVYTGCGTSSSLNVKTGISVGWGDLYSASLPDQYIDVTGLPPGRYRLSATADPSDWFTESKASNNSTYVDLQLTRSQKKGNYSVSVVAFGPEAKDSL